MRTLETFEKNTVVYLSPGTFVPEVTERDVETWDPIRAAAEAQTVTERYDAKPYAFYFRRVEVVQGPRGKVVELQELECSGRYFINGKVETLEEVEARATEDDGAALLRNMRINQIARIVTTQNGYHLHVCVFRDEDCVVTADMETQGK
jgi:hypothetical protein